MAWVGLLGTGLVIPATQEVVFPVTYLQNPYRSSMRRCGRSANLMSAWHSCRFDHLLRFLLDEGHRRFRFFHPFIVLRLGCRCGLFDRAILLTGGDGGPNSFFGGFLLVLGQLATGFVRRRLLRFSDRYSYRIGIVGDRDFQGRSGVVVLFCLGCATTGTAGCDHPGTNVLLEELPSNLFDFGELAVLDFAATTDS